MINLLARTLQVKQARKVVCNTTVNNNHFCTENRPFTASHSRGTNPPCSVESKSRTGTGQTETTTISNYVCLLFVLSQRDICSPAWQFFTTWMASCKGPISVLFHFIPLTHKMVNILRTCVLQIDTFELTLLNCSREDFR